MIAPRRIPPKHRLQDPFAAPVTTLRGVGARIAEKLDKLNVRTVGELLCLLPFRYEDRTRIRPIGSTRAGDARLVQGRIELCEIATRRRRALLCRITDGSGALTLRFFHFSSQLQQTFARGVWLRCFGETRLGPTGIEMVHPQWQIIANEQAPIDTALTPVYPSTEGLHQQRIRDLIKQALGMLDDSKSVDLLQPLLAPEWMSLTASLVHLHRPPAGVDVAQFLSGQTPWHQRIALEELIAHRISLKSRQTDKSAETAAPMRIDAADLRDFMAGFGFKLTAAQTRVIGELRADLEQTRPMNRLVQGDVGCGKTVVAATAALIAVRSGYQVALMAPTELLAEQHFANFSQWLKAHNVQVGLLSSAVKSSARTAVSQGMLDGTIDIVIGTHALFQDDVQFNRLGFVIIDEQHRFGVEQRLRLRRKGHNDEATPHQLVMTATPIPRTLAMTAYADLDCSTIDELPPGRTPIRTVVMQERRRADLVARIAQHCSKGRQAYWVCPLIDESELIESSAATELERELSEALDAYKVGLIHGRMRPADKDAIMREFKQAEIDVLVATTVIEVGVDVPNASLMIVENAERMGLAQLHQLRGRVGRGKQESSCVLLYKPPLGEIARQRLEVMRETTDGFKIAQHDLKLRGPGEVLGTRQTGDLQFRVADLARDAALLPDVIRISDTLLETARKSADALVERWIARRLDYADV